VYNPDRRLGNCLIPSSYSLFVAQKQAYRPEQSLKAAFAEEIH